MPLPGIVPMRLARLRDPFDHPEWIYEIKHDGFRGLADKIRPERPLQVL